MSRWLLALVLACGAAPPASSRNQLATASSPYLRQHGEDPVAWQPWGEQAFAEARRRDVPVFLSIGYAACHWCHVMQHESFQDPELAAWLNAHFVAIKVDRQERPDVDALYMDAVHALTGGGGWPASLWLNHDGEPFMAGTYFPAEASRGRPSFREVLEGVDELWRTQRDKVEARADDVRAGLYQQVRPAGAEPPPRTVQRGLDTLKRAWDPINQGWGRRKFPMVPRLELMLAYAVRHDDTNTGELVRAVLHAMDRGGIHDQLGGGFHRYTVDPAWIVPHFEKMAYDNGQLLGLYAEAAVALDEPRFAAVARDIAAWLERDLLLDDGSFASSLDADVDGEEGTTYLWTPMEVRAVLGAAAEPVLAAYAVTEEGNFDGHTTVLTRPGGGEPPLGADQLLAERSRRPQPRRDDQQVVAYNALVIRGLARSGRWLHESRHLELAAAAAERLLAARDQAGSLPRTLAEDSPPGVLDDHAFTVEALLELYLATHQHRWLAAADEVASVMVARFWDEGRGFVVSDDASLLAQQVQVEDGAEPGGYGRAVAALSTLRALGAPSAAPDRVPRALALADQELERSPQGVPSLLEVLDTVSMEVVVVHPPGRSELAAPFIAAFDARYRPGAVLAVLDGQARAEEVRFGALVGKVASDEDVQAYVCFDGVCEQPVRDVPGLTTAMDGGALPAPGGR